MPIPDEQAFTTGATEFGGTLEDRLRFETLLADLFARFVNVPADRLNREIGNAHRTICEALRIDHSSVWQITPDNPEEFVLIHPVRDPNLPPPPERMRGIDYFPWVQAKLQAKEVVIVEDTAKAPPEASTDLQSWQYFRLKSSLVFPLYMAPVRCSES